MHSSSDHYICTTNLLLNPPSSIPFLLDYDNTNPNPNPNPNPISNFYLDQDLQFINTSIIPNSPQDFEFLHLFYPTTTTTTTTTAAYSTHDFLLHHHHENPMNPTTPPPNMPLEIHSAMMMNCSYVEDNGDGDVVKKKLTKKKKKNLRSSNRDRHSKIHTVNGPRDRRMRLSLSVATKFFRLQDLLGFDKASCTVDWLLNNSAAAIHELKGGGGGSSCSGGEVGEMTMMTKLGKGKKKKGRSRRKAITVGKESRRKARERARVRTSQKRRLAYETNCTDLAFVESSLIRHDGGGAWIPVTGGGYLQHSTAGFQHQDMEEYLG